MKILTIIFLICSVLLLSSCIKRLDTTSIDSIAKMSCDELHANYAECRDSSSDYGVIVCGQLYLDVYHYKCPYGEIKVYSATFETEDKPINCELGYAEIK